MTTGRIMMTAVMATMATTAAGQRIPENNILPLPVVNGWTDNRHFILRQWDEQNKMSSFLVDAANGSMVPTDKGISKQTGKSLQVNDDDIYIVNGKNKQQLTHTAAKEANPVFSPDSNFIAFTRNNDLYTLALATGRETRLTHDGNDSIMNGYASWVYNEEILGRSTTYRSFWWSPDSKAIAFFRTDDSKVPVFTITDAGGYHGYKETQRYPQPGDANPSIRIGVVPATGGNTVWADFDEQTDQYFGTPYWNPDSKSLVVQWLNRGQDHYQLYQVSPATGAKKGMYEERQPTWINLDEDSRLTFVNQGKEYLFISDKSGYRQLYLHKADGTLESRVSQGDFVVADIKYIDEQHRVVYFTGNKHGLVRQDLYRADFTGKNMKRLTFGPYNHDVSFSPAGNYFTTKYGNASTPERLALADNKGKLIKILGDSKGPHFDSTLGGRSRVVFVKSEDGQFDIPMRVSFPAHMQPGKKYPLMIAIYGGPASSVVKDNWVNSYAQEEKDAVITVSMDHRGSTEFGKVGQNYMYRDLAKWPIKDWIQCVKWLIANGQADPEKVMISGYSFGGYMTCYALMAAPEYFKYGIAGGSVTDWQMYDSHYTERFMDTPAENPEGYKNSSVLTYTDKLQGKLLLMHGVIDDNVHVINTLELTDRLQRGKNMHFEMMLYPGNRHSIFGPRMGHYSELMSVYRKKWLAEISKDK
ncbi:S9 family peptidase [Chitinophaga arvensicola]|uniref:Dipeptidyl-peptidase IV Serine peptidase. MEROPS family S09B n=1 Tax=Chitinophaga arvensicola TaxID=29529 RepID=A0A1I0RQG8_9BACT|nr:S9 family peptidase [Chitinophaga arvensicola]SEW43345.1 dipeptidyl-peptidase IV Serine peptidase. MEROPS family S09B [Chitinophaga arvensicola]